MTQFSILNKPYSNEDKLNKNNWLKSRKEQQQKPMKLQSFSWKHAKLLEHTAYPVVFD
jgi:hypothetical protein